jgi:hypothetical protein
VAVGGREQQGIALLTLKDLLDAVADAPVRAVHVTGHDEEHRNRQMVVGDIAHPKAAGDGIQPTFEGEEVAVGGPVATEERRNASAESGIQLGNEVLVEELIGQRDIGH